MSRALSVIVVLGALAGCASDPKPSWRMDTAVDPVCGRKVETLTPWRESYGGAVYYFHSEECRQEFAAHPEYVDGGPRHPGYRRGFGPQFATDPVCGKKVDTASAVVGYFEDEPYYFHADGCRKEFLTRPQAYKEGVVDRPIEIPVR